MSDYKLVEVLWIDAHSQGDYIEVDCSKELEPLYRKNAGYLLCNDNKKVILCFGLVENLNEGTMASDETLVIPQEMVRTIRFLECDTSQTHITESEITTGIS